MKLFKWLFRLIVVLAIGFFAFALLITQKVFTYSTITYFGDSFSTSEKKEIQVIFEDTYLVIDEEGYTVFDPHSGLGITEKSINETGNDSVSIDFNVSGNYAYVEIVETATNDKITVAYFKASIIERVDFATKYYSWGI